MGQTWPIPEAHGHGALVTAERCFGIDMKVFPRGPGLCMREAASCLLNEISGAKNMLKGVSREIRKQAGTAHTYPRQCTEVRQDPDASPQKQKRETSSE